MVPSDSLISIEGGLKLASDVKLGDKLLTGKRRFSKVTDIQWEICDLYFINVKCRSNNILLADKTVFLTLDGFKTLKELNKFRTHSVCISQEISLQQYPDEDHDYYGGEDGVIFCPVNRIINAKKTDTVYNFITEDFSFCVDGLTIFNR